MLKGPDWRGLTVGGLCRSDDGVGAAESHPAGKLLQEP